MNSTSPINTSPTGTSLTKTAPKTPLSPPRRLALLVGGVLGIALIGWGVVAIIGLLIPDTTERDQRTFDPQAQRLTVDIGSGDLVLRSGDGDQVQVNRTAQYGWRAPDVEESSGPDGVEVRADCSGFFLFGCDVDYEITVPDGFTVELRASSGNVEVRDVTVEQLGAEVSSGDLDLSGVDGALRLQASSGDITADGLRSLDVEAEASSGEIRLGFAEAPDRVNVRASSGDVEIALPEGPYQVNADTSSGDDEIDVAQDPNARRIVDVQVSSGDVQIVPAG